MDDPQLDRTLDEPQDAGVDPPQRYGAGAAIGQFRIVRELGAGGMGIVFEAHDPDLDRRVAIKVVRGREADSAGGARLIREAQAMARLTHPNVVAVHEVGTIDGQVFVVMELVRGQTLAGWLDERRPWRQIVEALIQAGDGLVSAHHAGLVHRDFKPNNVLIDQAGRVRVTDFGLARADDEQPWTAAARSSERAGAAPSGPRARALGSGVVGTPAFMAPEQRAGEQVDSRADQYSFAMSLHHGLGVEHASGKVPRRIRAAIARGLAVDPDARFATLDALLDELRAALRTRGRRAFGGAITGVVVAAGLVTWAAQPQDDACGDGARLVDDIWTPAARGQLVASFVELRPHDAVAIASSAHLVDEWVAAWKLGRRAACKVDPEQRSARLGCLDQGLHDLRAQLAVWGRADGDVVNRAVDTAGALPAPGACAASREQAAINPALRGRLAHIHALERSGRPREARPETLELVKLADATGNPAVAAPAYFAAGIIAHQTDELAAARAYLSRAASEAGRAGMDARMLDALLLEATVVIDQGRPLDSLGILDAAAAIIARVGINRPERFALKRGDALTQAGRSAEGIEELQRAAKLLEQRAAHNPSARLELARGLGVLAGAHNQRFEWAKAHELLSRGLAIEEATLGPLHPEVGKTLHDLATNANRLGRFDEGTARLERARAIFVTTYGERSAFVGGTDTSLALAAILRHDYVAARGYYERALATLTVVFPAGHPNIANVESGLGTIDREQGRCASAIPHFERAIAEFERIGRDGTPLATQLVNLGACLAEVGRRVEARAKIERSLALLDQDHVPDQDKAEPWALLAELEHHAGHRDAAVALARKVLATTTDDDGPEWVELRRSVRANLVAWTR